MKKPEQVLKLFVRFALSKAVITYGLELMTAIFDIVQGVISKIIETTGLGTATRSNIARGNDNNNRGLSVFLKVYHYGQ